jgi:hypothetical protein
METMQPPSRRTPENDVPPQFLESRGKIHAVSEASFIND